MNVYVCVDHPLRWIIAPTLIIVAQDELQARDFVDAYLQSLDRETPPDYTLHRIDIEQAGLIPFKDVPYRDENPRYDRTDRM